MFGSLIPTVRRSPLARFERDMDSLFERFFGSDGGWTVPTYGFMPTVNVAETDSALEVTLEVPGMKPEELNVEFKDGSLWITGEKKEEKEEKGKTLHRIERTYGQFCRVIPMPTVVNEEKVEAQYKEGVLRILVPKTEVAKPKHITVKT